MPNRIIKESICSSDSIDELSWFEEVLFYRLIVSCDDYGRFDGRVKIIKNRLFPLKENITAKAITDGINKLASIGLVCVYTVNGKPILCLPTWNDHQNVRAKKSKYPSPEEANTTHEFICNQMNSDVPVIQSNPNPNPNPNTEGRARSRFTPPSLEEVREYCQERGNNVDAQRFIDYYTANGWLVGKNKMKDWKACVRTWEKNSFNQAQKPVKEKAFNTMQQRTDIDYDDIEARARQQLMGKQ